MDQQTLISVVIPVKNGAAWLNELLESLKRQTFSKQLEIICIDSESDDGSLSIINKHDAILIEVASDEFNHGSTRMKGVHVAKGDFVVMTVQDALPADNQWIEKLLAGFIDENVAGVCGQQIVPHHRDKNPVQWFRPVSEPKIEAWEFESPHQFDVLSPEQKKQICGWDDVTACYRREALMKVPFREINFAEDAAWAMDALRAGYKIIYNKKARVYHYHNENKDYTFKRTFTTCYHRYKLFGYVPEVPKLSIFQKAQIMKLLIKSNVPFKSKKYWWHYNLQRHKAAKSATSLFLTSLSQGLESVELMHEKICKEPPQAVFERKLI